MTVINTFIQEWRREWQRKGRPVTLHPFDLYDLVVEWGYRLTDTLPVLVPNEKGKPRATCPDCGIPLTLFGHEERLALCCYDCRWVWLTWKRDSIFLGDPAIVAAILPRDQIEQIAEVA